VIKLVKIMSVSLILVLCSACGDNHGSMPTQTWEGFSIEVQTRPPMVVEGMNEFLIIVSRDSKPAPDLILSIKMKGHKKWHQSIQDGRIGVYRRALSVKNKQQDVLLVHIRRGEGGIILEFPLREQIVVESEKPSK